jgi:hypothetical protein
MADPVDRGAALTAFLRATAEGAFVFGQTDCSMTVANWVKAARGRDPGAPLRGRYSTRLGWVRIVNRAGGLLPVFSRLLRQAGLRRTATPVPGDVGLVTVPRFGVFGAIKVKRGWFVRMQGRVVIAPFKHIAAWKV